ncbi:hypothetical protein [Edaphobacter bradus]|uniref:hypothetical protein n=1 Tax=Edaphobacter bradus TaxID=2259016 RepID=UPI0021E053C2|nr:hypothetical protein [Edaphobacter bradus]
MPSRNNNLFLRSLCTLAVLLLISPAAFSQLNSSTASVSLTATLGESLTISATPSAVNFALVAGGIAAGSSPVAITTTWVLGSGRANVVLDAYFSSTSAALTFAGPPVSNIPTSAVLGQVTTGTPTAFTSFTQTAALGTAGAGLTLFTQSLSSANRASSRTDNLNLEINLASLPQLPSATYTGTLTLQAQAL